MTDKSITEAISYFKYGVDCDIFHEPVITYATLAIEALKEKLEDTSRNTINALEKQVDEQRAKIAKLQAELEHQTAIAKAEIDTVHDLGDDYERVLENERLHIQTAKIEALNTLTRRLSSFTDRNGTLPFEYVPMAALEILAEGSRGGDE